LLSTVRAFISNAICEVERSFKQTSTASRLIFVRSLLPPAPLLQHHSRPRVQPRLSTGNEPLPSVEGCGLPQDLGSLRSEDATATAPPLSKGMWAAYACSTEEPGREKHEGGPMKWEAQVVSYETRATTFVVVRFRHESPHSRTDASNPATRTKRHPETTATPRHHDDGHRQRRKGSMNARRIRQRREYLITARWVRQRLEGFKHTGDRQTGSTTPRRIR